MTESINNIGEDKLWEPKIGETYFWIQPKVGLISKSINEAVYKNDMLDYKLITAGNCFKKKEKAKKINKLIESSIIYTLTGKLPTKK